MTIPTCCPRRYRGVSWDVSRQKWRAKIGLNEKDIFLGRFSREDDAARAYDAAARTFFGEFASLNYAST